MPTLFRWILRRYSNISLTIWKLVNIYRPLLLLSTHIAIHIRHSLFYIHITCLYNITPIVFILLIRLLPLWEGAGYSPHTADSGS